MPVDVTRKVDGRYEVLEKTGEGVYATVHKVKDRYGDYYAAKFCVRGDSDGSQSSGSGGSGGSAGSGGSGGYAGSGGSGESGSGGSGESGESDGSGGVVGVDGSIGSRVTGSTASGGSGGLGGSGESAESNMKPSFVEHELAIMEELYNTNIANNGTVATLRAVEFCLHGKYDVGVMELLGNTVRDLWHAQGRRFSDKTLIMIMKETLRGLQLLHNCGFVHRDIHSHNLMNGRSGAQRNRIYIIDYGLAYHWTDRRERGSMDGTFAFSSINANLRYTVSRADDIESLLYTMVYLHKRTLPWIEEMDLELLAQQKGNIESGVLMSGMPQAFRRIREHIRTVRFGDAPAYHTYGQWLDADLVRMRDQEDLRFDWS